MRLQITAAALLLVAAWPATGAPAAPAPVEWGVDVRPEPRGSILIEGDGDFTAENGVRGGSGTAGDPYVISDWLIRGTDTDAIRIRGTAAHVVIRNVLVPQAGGAAVNLELASNVTVERLRVGSAWAGVRAWGAHGVALHDVRLGGLAGVDRAGSVTRGFLLLGSSNVTMDRVAAVNTDHPLSVLASHQVAVSRATLEGTKRLSVQSFVNVVESGVVTIERTRISRAKMLLDGTNHNVTLVGNLFQDSDRGVDSGVGTEVRDVRVCGNTFRNTTSPLGALQLFHAERVVVRGNLFHHNYLGANIQDATDVTFERNGVANTTAAAVTIASDGARIHQNAFLDSPIGIFRDANATDNWWGHPTGPSGVGNGTGGELRTYGANVTYAPWLTSPPATGPGSVECGIPLGEPGVDATSVTASVEVHARIQVTGAEADARANARSRVPA